MSSFLQLPRELRDMIYTEVITWSRPLPTLTSTTSTAGWCRPWEPRSGLGDHGCAFSAQRAPGTCANFLACSRQVNAEMWECVERVRRGKEGGGLKARIDCMVWGEMHWFSWLGISLVRTVPTVLPAVRGLDLVKRWVVTYLSFLQLLPWGDARAQNFTTTIETLQIDVRLLDDGEKRKAVVESPRDRTSWAVCAALKCVFEHDPDVMATRDCVNEVRVGEVVLNVVSPAPLPTTPSSLTSTSAQPAAPISASAANKPAVDPKAVAKELVDVWAKLWAGDEFKARYYKCLLEKIEWVRVCVDGKTYRVRELAGELERGRKETARIAMRLR